MDINDDDAYNVFVYGKLAYVTKLADSGFCSATTSVCCEVQVYDISNPTKPVYKGGGNTAGSAWDVYVYGRYAYVIRNLSTGTCSRTVNTGCEFQIWDVGTSGCPRYVGGLSNGDANATSQVVVSGRYAYFGGVSQGGTCAPPGSLGCEFYIADISSSTNPVMLGGVDLGVAVNDVAVSGRYAYLVTDSNTGFCSATTTDGCDFLVYDVTTSSQPMYVGGAEMAGTTNGITISGRFGYLGKSLDNSSCTIGNNNGGCELQVFDISGLEASAVTAHSLEAGTLQVRSNAFLDLASIRGGLVIGAGGLFSDGGLSVFASSTTSTINSFLSIATTINGTIRATTPGLTSVFGRAFRSLTASGTLDIGGGSTLGGLRIFASNSTTTLVSSVSGAGAGAFVLDTSTTLPMTTSSILLSSATMGQSLLH